VGAFVLASRFGLDQGFESYDDRMSGQRAVAGGFLERSASAVTESALAWLERAPRPFFLWVHYYDPHREHEPPMPFAADFRERPYDGEIAYVDAEFGRLLAGLHAAGELAETLVVVTADHGESLGEHGEPLLQVRDLVSKQRRGRGRPREIRPHPIRLIRTTFCRIDGQPILHVRRNRRAVVRARDGEEAEVPGDQVVALAEAEHDGEVGRLRRIDRLVKGEREVVPTAVVRATRPIKSFATTMIRAASAL